MNKQTSASLRSARWLATEDLRSFRHRSRTMQLGYGPKEWVGKPVIAIINTWSDVGTCHGQCTAMGTATSMTGNRDFPLDAPRSSQFDFFCCLF